MGTQPLPERMTTSLRPDVWLLEMDIKAKRGERNPRHAMCDSVHIVCCRCDKTERVGTGQPPTRLINPIIVLTLCDCSTRMMHRSFLARSWAKCDYRIWMILKNSLRSFMFKLVHEQSEMNRSRKRSQNWSGQSRNSACCISPATN